MTEAHTVQQVDQPVAHRSAVDASSQVGSVQAIEVLLDILESEDCRYIFGNPGTTELPLMDALVDRTRVEYVLALQEATALGMADGYAQASGRPAFVNLHASSGLGNAMGALANARANQAPLVVTAGNQDRRHVAMDPILAGDLVSTARPLCKWSYEIEHAEELGFVLRRAFLDAMTPPTGPVFVSLPVDVLTDTTTAPPPARSERRNAVVPSPETMNDLLNALTELPPDQLCIVAGDEVAASSAVEALATVASWLGVRVFGSPLHGRNVLPGGHPSWSGPLRPDVEGMRRTFAPYRRVVLFGGQAFKVLGYAPGSPLPKETELVHVSPDAHELGRSHPTRLGILGDLRSTLDAVAAELNRRERPVSAAAALFELEARSSARRETAEGELQRSDRPGRLDPARAIYELTRCLPDDAAVVDESVTGSAYVRRFANWSAGSYYACRGGGLGWAMPASIGVALAGQSPVMCIVGDGSSMYSPQALWSAAHLRLPVIFAVLQNGEYRILKEGLNRFGGRAALTGTYPAMDLGAPYVSIAQVAEGCGVRSFAVESADEIAEIVSGAIEGRAPVAIEIPVR